MSKILGIDLGTTNSCMSVMEGGEPVVLENSEGARTTPSVLAFTKNGERLVGQAAKRQAVTNPTNTVFSVKRFMGRKFDELNEGDKRVPYKLVKAANGDAHIELDINGRKKTFSPPEVSAMILAKLKSDAEAKLGEKITKAIITVPAYFNDSQRNATKDAGKIAGLEVLRIINEPTAASLAYALGKDGSHKSLVYDWGGGHVSVVSVWIEDGVIEVIATSGDTRLGGDDVDQRIIDWIVSNLEACRGIDVSVLPEPIVRLRQEAERAKVSLSFAREYELRLPFLTADSGGPVHVEHPITRPQLELLCNDLCASAIKPLENCLRDSRMGKQDIDELLIIGGMTRAPQVLEAVRNFLGRDPDRRLNPDEAVAIGAAIQGGVLKGDVKDVFLLDVTPLTLAIETAGGIATPIIPRNTTIPTKKSQIYSTYSDNQPGVEIKVLQGEHPMAKDNKELGTLYVGGIPPSPRGAPRIEVIFEIDANGVLRVSGKNLESGTEVAMTWS